MDFSLPQIGESLGNKRINFLELFKKSCKKTMLQMLKTSQSGHPGGSLSCLDFLATLYAFRISKTNEKIVISNGHISPGVYSVLAEMGVINKKKLIETYRQAGSIYEGHVTRHIPGIYFGTGPLGTGISAGAGIAFASKKQNKNEKIFATLGDGECQEGQVHEMTLFASKYKLNNFVVFVDYNRVQLSNSLEKTMPIDVITMFKSAKWNVIEINGHNPEEIWSAIGQAQNSNMPTAIIGKTIMGKGIPLMEKDGANFTPTWHGKTPKPNEIDEILKNYELTTEEQLILDTFRKNRNFNPPQPKFIKNLTPLNINTGQPKMYEKDELTDCRSAYGNALLDLAKLNKNILASSADLSGSVKTNGVEKELPKQYIEFGISEQNMVSACGGLSLSEFIPFCSTFGAFMTSRAKDQARVNDINQTNVKMVSTHCGLSVGEDGPTHQAIDDMGSMLGLFNTMVMEPADPNQCDHMIRYVANHYGNFYVRMGRHKLPVLTKKNGSVFFDKNYEYEYGRTDILREGSKITIVVTGACVIEALQACEETKINAEIVIASSIKKFDENLANSIKKTKRVITVEDHNAKSGLASAIALFVAEQGINLDSFKSLAVQKYQLSGKPKELYHTAKIDKDAIITELKKLNFLF